MPRQWLVGLVAVLCVAHFGTARSTANAPLKMTIFFDGGNAYVRSDANPNAISIGAVSAKDPAHHFNRHRMKLQLEEGVVAAETTLLPQEGMVPTLPNAKAWDLYGWIIEICPEGVCPTSDTLVVPLERVSNENCQDPGDNLSLIPGFHELHPGKEIASDWMERLDSLLVLREGQLVIPAAKNCFELRRQAPQIEKKVRNVSGASKDVQWVLQGQGTFVDVNLKPKFGTGTRRQIRLLPSPAGEIQLKVTTTVLNYPRPEPPEEIEHFQQFYSLYDQGVIADTERWKLFAKIIRTEASPGTECPPAYFLVP